MSAVLKIPQRYVAVVTEQPTNFARSVVVIDMHLTFHRPSQLTLANGAFAVLRIKQLLATL